jgi:hypothetical protein
MMEWIRESSPRSRARITGAVYLAYFLTAILAQVLMSQKLIAFGIAANLFATSCYVLLTLLFFAMFKPVNALLSLVAAMLGLVGCVVMTLDQFYPASVPINPLLFFGAYCLLIGYLVFRSTFLPRVLGVFMALAGLGWLAFLSPTVARYLTLYIEGLGIFAEASLMLWLIVRGVTTPRLKGTAGAV